MTREKYAAVVVNRKVPEVDRVFHYRIPEQWQEQAECGMLVRIPFGLGNQELEGIIVEITEERPPLPEGIKLKEIAALLSPKPLFSQELLTLSRFMADYYCCPWVSALQAMLPAGLALTGRIQKAAPLKIYYAQELQPGAKLTAKQQELYDYIEKHPGKSRNQLKEQGFSENILDRMAGKDYLRQELVDIEGEGDLLPVKRISLNEEQEAALKAVEEEIRGQKRPFLLWGITGSGKTEIYARLLEQALAQGKQGMLLVPEIALTAQMVDFLQKRLQVPLAVLHSGLSAGQRRRTWEKIAQGEYGLVVGARSAVFAPLPNLGLIILDEEHETSYKQDNAPRFHCREIAKERCRILGAQLVLGSATPSLESVYQVQKKQYAFASLKNRYFGASPPEVEIVDMRWELREGNRSLFSRSFAQAIEERLAAGEQSLVLMNRRGYFTFFSCRECGEVLFCPHCSIPLAYHAGEQRLKCHYCAMGQPMPKACPQCNSTAIGKFGAGTQRVAAEAARLFPQARIARLDQDAAAKGRGYADIYRQMLAGEIDILVGTQMIAKGLDFPRVTLAGVLAADMTLNLPDWRAGERTFQLLTQLIGRTGRRKTQGQAIIQTYHPQAPPIAAAASGNYRHFYRQELTKRQAFGYPPFAELIRIILNGKEAAATGRAARILGGQLELQLGAAAVRGPAPAPWEKIKDRYRWHILLKGQDAQKLKQGLEVALSAAKAKGWDKDIFIQIDVDPYSFM